jgi:hypothetical protein
LLDPNTDQVFEKVAIVYDRSNRITDQVLLSSQGQALDDLKYNVAAGIEVADEQFNPTTGALGDAHLFDGANVTLSDIPINVAAGAAVTIAGNSDNITAATGDTLSVIGNSDAINGAAGVLVGLTGTGDSVNENNGTITLNANSTGTVNGSGDIFYVGAGDTATVIGGNNSVDGGTGAFLHYSILHPLSEKQRNKPNPRLTTLQPAGHMPVRRQPLGERQVCPA